MLSGLVRYHVLLVVRLSTREAKIAGIIPGPDGERMKQIGRNLTDCLDGFLIGYHDLIHDRSALFTRAFKRILEGASVKTIRLAVWFLNLNSFA